MAFGATFGRWLREQRRRLDLTQADLAGQVGCSEITIRKIEANERTPSRQIAELLAACLGVPGDERAAFVAFARGRAAAATPGADAPARPSAAPLPALPTRLIGRERDADAVRDHLLAEGARIVTLVGPPGIGKTSLALHVAAALDQQGRGGPFPDGVAFVALAAVAHPDLAIEAVAQALGAVEPGGSATAERLALSLRDRRLLVVLDNFEHLLPAAAGVAQLLSRCPGLRVLATSRAPLHIRGEQVFPLEPLALPAMVYPLEARGVARSPAVRLFVERARAAAPHFALTDDNAATVAAICARLDGLPLAIELVAPRCRALTPVALLSRLGRRLALLTGGPNDLPPRHQALRSAIAWSYELLGPQEQAIFSRLGVFAGSFDADAAEAVIGRPGVPELLAGLVDQSLVLVEPLPDGALRFRMLETLREFALEELAADGTLSEARRRHAGHYGRLAQQLAGAPAGDAQELVLGQARAEEGNLRAALEWFAEHDAGAGLSCAAALRDLWLARGALREGREWLARLLAAPDAPDAPRAAALSAAGFLAYQQGDHAHAEQLCREALALHRRLGDDAGVAAALLNLSRAALLQSRLAEAEELAEACLALYSALGDDAGRADALRTRALIAKDRGRLEEADRLCGECLQLYHALGDARGTARALVNRSTVAYWLGDYPRCGALAEQAAYIFEDLDDTMGLAYALESIGMVAYKRGRHAEAADRLGSSLELMRALHDKGGTALVLHELGLVAQARGDMPHAARLQREGLALAWEIGDRRRAAFCLEALAAAEAGSAPLDSAQLFGAAWALRRELGTPVPEAERVSYEQDVSLARDALPAESFARAWEAGAAAPADEIVSAAARPAAPTRVL